LNDFFQEGISMSTRLLYHAFGLRGYRYVKSEYLGGGVVFTVEPEPKTLSCTACGSSNVFRSGEALRNFHTLPIGSRQVMLQARIPRLVCRECHTVRQAAIGFAEPRRTYTMSFERYVLELSQSMTILDVAKHLNVSWDIVKEIQKRNLNKHFAKPKLKHLTQLAIDEIAVSKGHRYLTVVLDLESGAVVFVGDGKGANALLPFWKRLRASHAKIQAVATDMSSAYIDAVTTHLPKAVLPSAQSSPGDRFHVMKLYNEKLSQLRRDLQREATDGPMKKSIKGTRWLLVKKPENLDWPTRRNQQQNQNHETTSLRIP
jgi:transposase